MCSFNYWNLICGACGNEMSKLSSKPWTRIFYKKSAILNWISNEMHCYCYYKTLFMPYELPIKQQKHWIVTEMRQSLWKTFKTYQIAEY